MKTKQIKILLTLLLFSTVVSVKQADNDNPCQTVKKEDVNEAKFALESDIPVGKQNKDAHIPLIEAVKEGDLKIVELLLEDSRVNSDPSIKFTYTDEEKQINNLFFLHPHK